jgi:hypothetical protein
MASQRIMCWPVHGTTVEFCGSAMSPTTFDNCGHPFRRIDLVASHFPFVLRLLNCYMIVHLTQYRNKERYWSLTADRTGSPPRSLWLPCLSCYCHCYAYPAFNRSDVRTHAKRIGLISKSRIPNSFTITSIINAHWPTATNRLLSNQQY